MDTISEKLTVFALDNATRTLTEAIDARLLTALPGALLLDMVRLGLFVPEDGQLRLASSAAPKKAYLNAVYASIAPRLPLPLPEALQLAGQQVSLVKPQLLEALAKEGMVRVDKSKLKWSFALKSYVLKADKKGLRRKLSKAFLEGKGQLTDFWVLQLASAAELLAGGGIDKKAAAILVTRISSYSAVSGISREIARQLAGSIPPAGATALEKGKKLRDVNGATWEWRGFWPDNKGATLIRTSQAYRQSLENLSFEETTDDYLLLEGLPENIKIRKGALEIKRPIESIEGYTAYLPKETYPFPIDPVTLQRLFPLLEAARIPAAVASPEALQSLLTKRGYQCQRVETKKKRFLVKLKNQVRVEFCSLTINGRKYVSSCVEGGDYATTHAHALNFQSEGVQVLSYVDFLKSLHPEPVA